MAIFAFIFVYISLHALILVWTFRCHLMKWRTVDIPRTYSEKLSVRDKGGGVAYSADGKLGFPSIRLYRRRSALSRYREPPMSYAVRLVTPLDRFLFKRGETGTLTSLTTVSRYRSIKFRHQKINGWRIYYVFRSKYFRSTMLQSPNRTSFRISNSRSTKRTSGKTHFYANSLF